MAKAMGVSPITDTIYYGNLKNDKWVGKRKTLSKWQSRLFSSGLCTNMNRAALMESIRYVFREYHMC